MMYSIRERASVDIRVFLCSSCQIKEILKVYMLEYLSSSISNGQVWTLNVVVNYYYYYYRRLKYVYYKYIFARRKWKL
jgi:hypothetical protein